MHDGEKPFICYCGASFTLKGNLNRHRKDKQCQPGVGRELDSSSKEEEAAKILNEMSSRKSKRDSEAEGSPTPKKKRKSVPRKTMSQEDAANDVDEEVAAAWQLMKDNILQEDDDEDEEDEEEEDEEAQDGSEEADQKPNYAELMAMFPEHGADIEDDNMTTRSSNAQSMFQCLDSSDPAFQFPADSRAIEVTSFLNPFSSSELDQTTLKYQSDTTDASGMSTGLISNFQTHDTVCAVNNTPRPHDVAEMAPSRRKTRTATHGKVLASGVADVCTVPVVDSGEVEVINSTLSGQARYTDRSDGLRRKESVNKANEISGKSNDDLEKTISDVNADDDGYSADDGLTMSPNFSHLRPKVARLGKKASLAALFGAKLVPEHGQT